MAAIEEEIKSEFKNDYHKAFVNVLFTANWLSNLHSSALKPYKISTQQFNILRILRGGKTWMAMTDVKGRMVEKSPNTTRLADKLLNQKYLERKRSSTDRRVVFVRISKKGLSLLTEIDAAWKLLKPDLLLDGITEKKVIKLSDYLDKLRNSKVPE